MNTFLTSYILLFLELEFQGLEMHYYFKLYFIY